jgi:Ni/Fe-hydrogenase subunit HybB-like protein
MAFAWLGCALALTLAGLAAAHYMDVNGHWVTGMNNHVVWGIPHVFAITLIVCASGAVNVASLSSVFGRREYAPGSRLGVALALCLLVGGLAVLVLDLGRPDRLIVAMTHYNFSSVFAWNIFLYTGFAGLLAVYLWFSMERQHQHRTKRVGKLVLVWRMALTSGTGFIFGFLVARDGYDAAILAPLFVAASLALGTAAFTLTFAGAMHVWRPGDEGQATRRDMLSRLGSLISLFVLVSLYLSLAFHIANSYVAEHDAFERFILSAGGGYSTLFWVGYVVFGSLVPVVLLATPLARESAGVLLCAALVLLGGFCQLYVIIIGGQAFPMDLVPGWDVVSTTFLDGRVAPYTPRLPEWLLGLGGVGFAYLLLGVAVRVLALLPGHAGQLRKL